MIIIIMINCLYFELSLLAQYSNYLNEINSTFWQLSEAHDYPLTTVALVYNIFL